MMGVSLFLGSWLSSELRNNNGSSVMVVQNEPRICQIKGEKYQEEVQKTVTQLELFVKGFSEAKKGDVLNQIKKIINYTNDFNLQYGIAVNNKSNKSNKYRYKYEKSKWVIAICSYENLNQRSLRSAIKEKISH